MAVLATVALATGPAMLSNAHADDLKDKKHKAHQGVKNAMNDLEDSSKELVAATRQLQAAQGQLVSAQSRLAATQGELTTARVLDAQMQTKLVAAEAALAQAQSDVAAGRAKVIEQRAAIGRIAVESYQYGDPGLIQMSVLLKGRSPEEISTQLNTVDSLMSQESAMLADLKATEALLVVQEKQVEAAKATVAEQRQEAAVNLARKKALEQQAVVRKARVVALVGARKAAASQARAARASDQRKLQQLKKEEARIRRLIQIRASQNHSAGYSGDTGAFLLPPVANSYITSPYGWRKHPIYGYWGLHDGDDYHAPCGVPERASASGTVMDEYYSDVWGNRLFLDVGRVNGKTMTLIYNHISSYKARTGDKVRRGETVAYAGTTGWSTACHLHFTVMLDGKAVDPQRFM